TDKGSVFNENGSRTERDLVLEYKRENKASWGEIKTPEAANLQKSDMRGLIESVLNTDFTVPKGNGELLDTRKVGEMYLRSFILKPEYGISLPGVLLGSGEDFANRELILFISDNGKAEILKNMDLVNGLLGKGYLICAVDLRGIGETSPDMADRFWDFLAGKPIFGQRVKDILYITEWLKSSTVKAKSIKYWGKGMGSLYGAFAGVFTDHISGFVLEEP